MTEIKSEYPPNIKQIAAKFPGARGKGVIFAYAPFIYAPHHRPETIPAELIAHEELHIARQKIIGVEKWWSIYISNARFRYIEEMLAHRAEYQALSGMSRQLRRSALKVVAKKLSAALYGYDVSLERATIDIGAHHIEGCPACHGLGVALTTNGVECGKCEGVGYLEFDEEVVA